jgi:hypothetical protein
LLNTRKKIIIRRKRANKTANVLPTHTERIKPGNETKARIQVTLGESGGKACRVKTAVK